MWQRVQRCTISSLSLLGCKNSANDALYQLYLLKVSDSVEAERHHGVLVNLYGVLGGCLVERMRGEPYVTFRQGGAVWLGRAGRGVWTGHPTGRRKPCMPGLRQQLAPPAIGSDAYNLHR